MLEYALNLDDEVLIKNTISKLPLEVIPKLLSELQKCLFYKGEDASQFGYMRWLETLLQNKLSFILTMPELGENLGPIRELLNARTDVFDRLLRLKGRLNFMLSQTSTVVEVNKMTDKEALLKFQEDTSSDEEGSDDESLMDLIGNDARSDDEASESGEATTPMNIDDEEAESEDDHEEFNESDDDDAEASSESED